MEKDSKFLTDDYFYPSDLEEELEHVVGVEDILEGPIGSTSEFAFTSTLSIIYFNLLNYEPKYEGDEKGNGG
jgi:hypothetical protein